jgi:hypothetical protein
MKSEKRLQYEKAYRKKRYETVGRSEYFTTKAERKEFKLNAITLLKNFYNDLIQTSKNEI